jgi:hypothetical protein
MLHPSENPEVPLSVRDGQGAPVTCAVCGCRLEAAEDGTFGHFRPLGGRDARGCRVDCVDLRHDVRGRALAA